MTTRFPELDRHDIVETPELVPVVVLRNAIDVTIEALEAAYPSIGYHEPLTTRNAPEPWLAQLIVAQASALGDALDAYRHATLLRLPPDYHDDSVFDLF